MQKKQHLKIFLTYLLSILLAILALLLNVVLTPLLGTTSFPLIFFPAILASAWYGGVFTGLVTTLITAIAIEYFSLHMYTTTAFKQVSPMLQIALFLVEGYVLSFLIDIGKRGSNSIAYRRREKENIERILLLEQIHIKTQEEIRSRDEFLSVASHELKTPLTSMLLQIQTALHNIRTVSLAEFSVEHLLKMLESAENKTKRLSRMINDLLNVSVMTTGRLELELEETNLGDLVKDVLDDFAERLEKENYAVHLEVTKDIVGQWDKVRIEQVISNLIANAIKYGKGKPIRVTVEQNDTMAKMSITDQGIGIPAKEQERIFALFQRAVPSHDYKGLGVGLYITNQIIKAHGGSISVSSKEGKGSTFVIKLPIHKQQ